MKLAVSNVAWYNGRINEFAPFIAGLGCSGIELALSMVWPDPLKSSKKERADLRNLLIENDLVLTGFQALLYSRPDLVLFGDEKKRNEMLFLLTGLMDICHDIGGEVLVFGSPRNRNAGSMPKEKSRSIALEFFRQLGKKAEERSVFFCIEPLGRAETDFINTVHDAHSFIEELGNPEGLGLHIDTKGIFDEHETDEPYLTNMFSIAKHIHISEPDLKPVGLGHCDHETLSRKIRMSRYNRFISIEMKRNEGNVEKTIASSVSFVKNVYFDGD